jgi:MFS family permease
MVVAGGLADRFGRVKLSYVGLALRALGSLLIALSPASTAFLLLTRRIIQGLSAARIKSVGHARPAEGLSSMARSGSVPCAGQTGVIGPSATLDFALSRFWCARSR